MFLVQVIEKGTGKLLAEYWNRNRKLVEEKKDEFKTQFPNASVIFEYNS